MSKVDIYSCRLSEERIEPHGSTVFLFINIVNIHVHVKWVIWVPQSC